MYAKRVARTACPNLEEASMKHSAPIRMFAGIVLTTALAACGSSSTPNGSTATTGTNGSSVTTTTSGTTGTSGDTNTTATTTGNTNTTTNANTTTSTGTATISVTGTLGSMAFTGKDAIYATDTIGGVPFIYAVLGDAPNLCNAFGSTGTYDGNLVVIALVTDTGSAITAGDYTIEDPNSASTTSTLLASATQAVGIANVAMLASNSNSTEIDATSGDVNVTTYTANSPLVFTLSAAATGSATGGGLSGNVSAPACAALATVLQDGSSTSTTSTLLARARRVFVTNLH